MSGSAKERRYAIPSLGHPSTGGEMTNAGRESLRRILWDPAFSLVVNNFVGLFLIVR